MTISINSGGKCTSRSSRVATCCLAPSLTDRENPHNGLRLLTLLTHLLTVPMTMCLELCMGMAKLCCCGVHARPNDVPSEKGRAGANGYTYFVCNQLGGALSCLPPVKPSHIKAARQVKKFVSGKLDAQVSRLLHE